MNNLLDNFKKYLLSLNLSPVSRKLYLADVRRFLIWLERINPGTLLDSSSYSDYLESLRGAAMADSMILRSLASLRQLGSYLALTYNVPSPTSPAEVLTKAGPNKYIKHFINYLNQQHLSPLTIKSYKSDITRYLQWVESYLPSNEMTLVLNQKNIGKYLNYLCDSGTSTGATIERKRQSLARFQVWHSATYPAIAPPDSKKESLLARFRSLSAPQSIAGEIGASPTPDVHQNTVKKINYRNVKFASGESTLLGRLNQRFITSRMPHLPNFISLAILLLFMTTLIVFGYRQIARDKVILSQAYPGTPVTPNRQLSFQGRLEDAGGTPITSPTNFIFKLWDNETIGAELYSSGVCSITPDTDGVFSTQIGATCGSGIGSGVFTEHPNVWLEVTVDTETLAPRQQIATVAYALNSETIQGFPISSTVSAIRNTVVPMNQWGEIIVGEQSPRLTGVAGTFQISAPSLSLVTATGTNGNITLAPDGTGQVNVNGNTTSSNFFNVSNSQLTTGSLITGTAANNNTGFLLLNLLSGSTATSQFSVSASGDVQFAGALMPAGLPGTAGQFLTSAGSGTPPSWTSTIPASSVPFSGVTSGTNTTATMTVGSGATLDYSGTGTINASTIDSLDSGQFLRSDTSDNFTSGTLTTDAGTTLDINGDLIVSDSNVVFDAANTTFTTTGDLTINAGGGDVSLAAGDNFSLTGTLTADGLLDANGQVDLGDGGDSVSINGSSVSIVTTGAGSDITLDAVDQIILPDFTNAGSGCTALATDGSGFLTCGTGGTGSGSNWQENLGTLSPINSTWDILIGGTATSSAKIGLINIDSGTPTATISANSGDGATYLTGTGILGTANRQTLQLGDASTGNINFFNSSNVLSSGGNLGLAGNVGIGGTAPTASWLDIAPATNAKSQINLSSSGGIDPSSPANGDLWWNGTNLYFRSAAVTTDLLAGALGGLLWTDGGTYLYPTGAETLGNSVSGGANKITGLYLADSSPLVFGTDNDVTFSFAGSELTTTLGSNTWNIASNLLFLNGATNQIGIGTNTPLATLDVRALSGTTPVASFSGDTAMATVVVDQSGIGDLFTASKSGDTKFVITNAGNVGIGVSAPTNKLEIGGATSTISNTSGDITIDSFSNNISFAGDSLINILNLYAAGEVGIGLADAVAKLDVSGAVVGKALVMFDELGDQDIFTASASGVTRFRLTNSGSLSLDGDYINFALTDGATGYGIRDNAGVMEFKSLSGAWTPMGAGGASWWDQVLGTLQPYNKTVDLLLGGTATSSAKIALINIDSGTPTASLSAGTAGGAYLTATGILATTAKQTLALGDATTTGDIILQGGNVGIGVASPVEKLEVNGIVVAQKFTDTAGSGAYYLDPAATGTSLSIDGNIVGNGAFYLSTGSDAISVSIGTTGIGKLDVGTVDPPYTINGEKFATYMTSMTGVKEETTGVVRAEEFVPGLGYRATLDFAGSLTGSDLWLFNKVSNLQNNLDKLVVLLSGSGNAKTWYEIDAQSGRLYLYASAPTSISYRLTAPRFDSSTWLNTRGDDSTSLGFVIDDQEPWSVPEAISSLFSSAGQAISQVIASSAITNLQTDLISPLASGSAITIASQVMIKPENDSTPALFVEGEIEASTISARTAYLQNIEASTITARNIVADTIEANHIIGLDAKLATLSSELSDSEISTITDRIKARLADLTGNVPTAQDIPAPEDDYLLPAPASSSSTIASADIDFAIINDYLAVIGSAAITDLDITGHLYSTNLDSKTGTLALASGTLIVNDSGEVAINGNLTVSGKILADSAELNTLSLGTPSSATSSALGQLLSIYNEQGQAVATIDASGSANLASLTTGLITIASSSEASQSATSSALASALSSSTTSNATAGESKLVSPNTELTIESPYITPNSLVYLTPTTNTDNKVLYVKSKESCTPYAASCTPSFTVAIDAPASTDISFNWWVIQLAPPKEVAQ